MRFKIRLLQSIIFIALILNSTVFFAKHIVGGEASYKLISSDRKLGGKATYEFRFVIYRDYSSENAGDFDSKAYIGIFRKDSSEWVFYNRANIGLTKRVKISNALNPCLVAPKKISYEKGEYVFRLTLPIIDKTYKITYQRCCRTDFIVNIYSPEATGATYFVDITPEAQLLGNSSPVLKSFPPTVLCSEEYFEFDHSATDIDGDSLVYEFVLPFHGGGLAGSTAGTRDQINNCDGVIPLPDFCPPPYPNVVFKPPFTYDDPIQGNPSVRIDKFSGLLNGKPSGYGQYVVGVIVKEYRNGKLIGAVQRDFQFQVTNCVPAVNAVIDNSNQVDVDEFELLACGVDTFTFKNISYYRDKVKSTYWEFNIDGKKIISTDWDATIVFPGIGTYKGKLVLNKGVNCQDSAKITIKVFPGINADFEYEYDTCAIDTFYFFDKSISGAGPIQKWYWDFGNGFDSNLKNPTYFYDKSGKYNARLIVEDENKCRDTSFTILSYFPLASKIEIEPSRYLGCTPTIIHFDNKTRNFTGDYDIIWDFGDGDTSSDFSPTHSYKNAGIYSVTIKITSPLGCVLKGVNTDLVEIRKSPIADFTYTPLNPSITKSEISFENNSIYGKSYLWNFGNGDISLDFEPKYIYKDTGNYNIMLVTTSENHCADTLFKSIFISSDINMFFPNAFTPNGDGTNDEFVGKFLFPNYILDYNITIWDRWGGLVFQSNDPTETWKGSKFNTGGVLPQGVYVYKYNYKSPSGKIFGDKGVVTIVK